MSRLARENTMYPKLFGEFQYPTPPLRNPFCCFTTSQDLATFFDCHRQAFAHFGGVPMSIVYDRTKTVVRRHVAPSLRSHLHQRPQLPTQEPTRCHRTRTRRRSLTPGLHRSGQRCPSE